MGPNLHMKSLFFFIFFSSLCAIEIDVVIPCVQKDLAILNECIASAKKNVVGCRRVIVVSPERLTSNAEWFDEKLFPFSKDDVGSFLTRPTSQFNRQYRGWYLQQLLKFYAPFVIPDISENVLVLDGDTVLLQRLNFLDPNEKTIFYITPNNAGLDQYIHHMNRLHKTLVRTQNNNPVVNLMLFQKDKLEKLFELVETAHGKPFWQAFCEAVIRRDFKYGASEYTIYFFFFTKYFPNNYIVKAPKWSNFGKGLYEIPYYQNYNYAFVTFNHYNRRAAPSGLGERSSENL